MVEMLVVVALLVFSAVVFLSVPDRNARQRTQQIMCVNNLRQIVPAILLWSTFHDDKFMMETSVTNGGTMELVANGLAYLQFRVISNELFGPQIMYCPADDTRAPAKSFGNGDFGNTNLSYFLNVDATKGDIILVGDRNISLNHVPVSPGLVVIPPNGPVSWTAERHKGGGNVGLVDGSVQQLSLAPHHGLDAPGVITNRWVVP